MNPTWSRRTRHKWIMIACMMPIICDHMCGWWCEITEIHMLTTLASQHAYGSFFVYLCACCMIMRPNTHECKSDPRKWYILWSTYSEYRSTSAHVVILCVCSVCVLCIFMLVHSDDDRPGLVISLYCGSYVCDVRACFGDATAAISQSGRHVYDFYLF